MRTLAISVVLAALAIQPSSSPPRVPVGPFIVFFDRDKAEITPPTAAILDNVAAAYLSSGSAPVTIAGHSDRAGAAAHNLGLSQRRADSVKAYLAGRGIPEPAMGTIANGEEKVLVDTPDGAAEPQNRNVQIMFGPPSTS